MFLTPRGFVLAGSFRFWRLRAGTFPDMPTDTVTRRLTFNAAHRFHTPSLSDEENARLFGRCNNPNWHGHNYVLELFVRGPIDPRTRYVLDSAELNEVV